MESQRIAIVGYGSAGQASAVLLERDGHEVTVFERVTKPGPVGAGFLLQPSGLQVLWRMGLLEPVLRHGARVDRLFGDTPCGRAAEFPEIDRRITDEEYEACESYMEELGIIDGYVQQKESAEAAFIPAFDGTGVLRKR